MMAAAEDTEVQRVNRRAQEGTEKSCVALGAQCSLQNDIVSTVQHMSWHFTVLWLRLYLREIRRMEDRASLHFVTNLCWHSEKTSRVVSVCLKQHTASEIWCHLARLGWHLNFCCTNGGIANVYIYSQTPV